MENYPASIIKDAVEGLSKNLRLTSGEIATFKEALCGIAEKMSTSSDRLLNASRWYFLGSCILTAVIAFSVLVQAGVVNFRYW